MGTYKLHIHNVDGWHLIQKIQVSISLSCLIEIDVKAKWPYVHPVVYIYSGMKVIKMSHEKQNTGTH